MQYILRGFRILTKNAQIFRLTPQFWRIIFANNSDKPDWFTTFLFDQKIRRTFIYQNHLNRQRIQNQLRRDYYFRRNDGPSLKEIFKPTKPMQSTHRIHRMDMNEFLLDEFNLADIRTEFSEYESYQQESIEFMQIIKLCKYFSQGQQRDYY